MSPARQPSSHRKLASILLFALFILFHAVPAFSAAPFAAAPGQESALIQGKRSLEAKDYDRAVVQLTAAREAVAALADYALLWRAQAYEAKGETGKALVDLESIGRDHPDSPLCRKALRRAVEIRLRIEDPLVLPALERFVRDYPSETDMKFSYAVQLGKKGREREARKVFKEIYLTPSALSGKALAELPPSEISAEDLLKRARNLNEAWHFEEAEATFREALRKDRGPLKKEILDGLGYSLFRQKRYRESAGIFKSIQAHYWQARSLLRADDIEQFEALLPQLMKSPDKRLGQVILDYGTRKRRTGDLDAALTVYDSVLSRYPSMREEVLWAKAWGHFLGQNYDRTLALLTELSETSGESRYRYWKAQTAGLLAETGTPPAVSGDLPGHRDFYGYLTALEGGVTVSPPRRAGHRAAAIQPPTERVDLLLRLGLAQEASAELLHLSRKNGDPHTIKTLSVYLNRLDDYKASVALAARLPYSEDLHELLYPLAYWPEVDKASRDTGVDPLLILAVIREESRFAVDARSIAGALGLMQLMPATGQRLSASANIKMRGSEDLLDQRTNILLGTSYLKTLISTFNSLPAALAAYNAGEHNVREWLRKGRYRTAVEFTEDIPFSETRNYVKKVLATYFEYLRAAGDHALSRARTQMGVF